VPPGVVDGFAGIVPEMRIDEALLAARSAAALAGCFLLRGRGAEPRHRSGTLSPSSSVEIALGLEVRSGGLGAFAQGVHKENGTTPALILPRRVARTGARARSVPGALRR
jgi:hypothetical protein